MDLIYGRGLRERTEKFFQDWGNTAKDWSNTAFVGVGMFVVAPVMYKLGQDSGKEVPSDWANLFARGGLWTLGLGAAVGTVAAAWGFNDKWNRSKESLQGKIGGLQGDIVRLEGEKGELLNRLDGRNPLSAHQFRNGGR